MKEIQKTKEHIEYITIYQANDGTEFTNKEECEKYENSAHAVVRTKFLKLVIDKKTEYNLFNAGNDEDIVYLVKLNSQEDADAVLQLYYLDNPYVLRDEETPRKCKERAYTLVTTALKEHDVLYVGENYDGEIYLIDTRANIINRLLEADKPKEKKDELQ